MSLDGQTLDLIKGKLREGSHEEALNLLRTHLTVFDDFTIQARAARLFKSFPELTANLAPLKVALVASSTVEHLAEVLRVWLALAGFASEFYIAPFDMVVQTILDPDSPLYQFHPDVVWLCTNYRDVRLEVPAGADLTQVREAVGRAVAEKRELWQLILSRQNCLVVQNNADSPAHDPFGNISGTAPWGERNAYRLYNFELGMAAPANVIVFDLDHVASTFGKERWFDNRYWLHSKHAHALDASGCVAGLASRLIATAKGRAKKCLVLDLDNTLWGGVVGDDGLNGIALGRGADGEAFIAFQRFVRQLKDRGIVLAVSSKNEDENARAVFEQHPDMHLKLDDIAVFRANWDDKVKNISSAAATLNLGLDSFVFVDDNPVERELVRRFLPMVEVPEMPEDPAGYIPALASRGYFEMISFSNEDKERARYYQENAQRAELQLSFADTASYLKSLRMVGEAGSLDSVNLARMAQLINKSNQFHLTGTRYSENELDAMSSKPGCFVRRYRLADRFGDNGLIAVVVARKSNDALEIDTWVMSCRVLARSMEEFICNDILDLARSHTCAEIVGRYVPSAKNKLVAGLYTRLGFEALTADGRSPATAWRAPVDRPRWITYVNMP